MKNYIQKGDMMPYTNGGSTAIAAGDPVLVNNRLGVATVDIAVGATGNLAMTGVFTLPKITGAMNQGTPLYWDPAGSAVGGGTGALTGTAGSLNLVGYVFKAAVSADAKVACKLLN